MRFRYVFLAALLILFGAALLSTPLSRRVFEGSRSDHVVVIVDAGHGGEDGGAVGADGTKDSDDIAYPDSAVTTRQRKRADQEYRAALIGSTDKAVLVSIHQNTFPSPGPSGAQVFFGSAPGSEGFAKTMQEMLNGLCRGKRHAASVSEDIYLFRQAPCPSILVECGFLSNPDELALLRTDGYRAKLALVLAAGCLRQYHELEALYGKG